MEDLPAERIEDARPPGAIELRHIRQSLDRRDQTMLISEMIREVNEFFNVGNGMTARQMKLTAELILDNPGFSDLTLGNVKACFRQRMMSEKLYNRLDGNIIIGWLREFKSDMADWCENRNLGRDRMERQDDTRDGAGAIAFETYMAMLESRANDGDKEAQKTLAEFRRRAAIKSAEQTRQDRLDFHKFKMQYLKERQLKEQQNQ